MKTRTVKAIEIQSNLWTVDRIKFLIANSNKAAITALIKIHEYQTDSEKNCKTTLEDNGVGFNGSDGHLSKEAEFFIKKGVPANINEIQSFKLDKIRDRMQKYATQYFKILAAKYPENIKTFSL